MAANSLVTISVNELLRFFDEKPVWSQGQATSIVGVVGEDLNTACFQRYLRSTGISANVLTLPNSHKPWPVTTGKTRGPRLDRWIRVDWPNGRSAVFQTEIKNWSAHAIGGKTLSASVTTEELMTYRQKRWEGQWDDHLKTLTNHSTGKVLVRMKPPDGVHEDEVRPLLIFWEAIGPREEKDRHLFSVNASTREFPFKVPDSWTGFCKVPELWVFSVSSYLRSVREATIELSMPVGIRRLQILNELFSVG